MLPNKVRKSGVLLIIDGEHTNCTVKGLHEFPRGGRQDWKTRSKEANEDQGMGVRDDTGVQASYSD